MKDFPEDYQEEPPDHLITPMVLADPLNPGYYLPAVYKYRVGDWAGGKLVLEPGLKTSPLRSSVRNMAMALAHQQEEENPLP